MKYYICLGILGFMAFLGLTVGPALAEGVPTVDGTIGEDEYPRQIQDSSTKIEIHWYNDEVNFYVGLRSPGLGWVAVGFEQEAPHHQGANLIMSYVSGGELFIDDQYGTGLINHESDVGLGGTSDILEYAGMETQNETIIEFKIPLNSGDMYDKTLEPNKNYTILVICAFFVSFAYRIP